MKRIWTVLLVLCCALPALAQNVTLSGTISGPSTSPAFNGQLELNLYMAGSTVNSSPCGNVSQYILPTQILIKITNGALVSPPHVWGADCLNPQNIPYRVLIRDTQGNLIVSDYWLITGPTFDVGTAISLNPATNTISYLESVYVNGGIVTSPDFNNTTPGAPPGYVNCTWQSDGAGHVSCFVPESGGGGGGSGCVTPGTAGFFLYDSGSGCLSGYIDWEATTSNFLTVMAPNIQINASTTASELYIIGNGADGINICTDNAGGAPICPTAGDNGPINIQAGGQFNAIAETDAGVQALQGSLNLGALNLAGNSNQGIVLSAFSTGGTSGSIAAASNIVSTLNMSTSGATYTLSALFEIASTCDANGTYSCGFQYDTTTSSPYSGTFLISEAVVNGSGADHAGTVEIDINDPDQVSTSGGFSLDVNGGAGTSIEDFSPIGITIDEGLPGSTLSLAGDTVTVYSSTPALFEANGSQVCTMATGCSGAGVSSINTVTGAFTFSFSAGAGSCTGTTCTFTGSSTGGGSVINFIANTSDWPTWFVPTVLTSTTTPTLKITASAIPNSALANASITINSTTCTLGSSCTVSGGGGGSMTWPSGGAGIPNYSGSSSWGVTYSSSNTIPSNFLPVGSGSVFGAVKCGTGTTCSAGVLAVSVPAATGTTNQIALYTGSAAIGGDSLLSDNGTVLAYTGTGGLQIGGASGIKTNTSSNTDITGEFTMAGGTTAGPYTWTGTYSVHPEVTLTCQFDCHTNPPWVTYTGTTSFTINFASAATGAVTYSVFGRN